MKKNADSLHEVIQQVNFRKVLSEFKDARVKWPSSGTIQADSNSNAGLMRGCECPECNYFGGIIWKAPSITVSLSDKAISSFWLHQVPSDSDVVTCPMCGYEDIFESWTSLDLLEPKKKHVFHEDEYVCCLRRVSGTGREWVNNLVKFHAKRGVDGVVRWCMVKPPLLTTVPNDRVARQIARFLNLRYIRRSLSHRQKVITKETIAQDAMLNI